MSLDPIGADSKSGSTDYSLAERSVFIAGYPMRQRVLACHNVTNSATIHKTAISVAFVLEFAIRHTQERNSLGPSWPRRWDTFLASNPGSLRILKIHVTLHIPKILLTTIPSRLIFIS